MSSQVITRERKSRGPAQLWPVITLPTSAFVVWAITAGGEALRFLGLGAFVCGLTLPLLASLEAGLIGMMLFEPLRGLIRRAQYLFLPYTQSDPIHVVTPLVTLLAFIVLLQRRGLGLFTQSQLAKLTSVLALIYFFQIFNPLQGSIVVGLSGALFILVPVAWFYFGTEVRPEFARTALQLMVIAALITSLYGLYHLAYGFPRFEQYWLDNTDAYDSIAVGKIKRALATFSSAEEWGRYIEFGAIAAFGFGAGSNSQLRRVAWWLAGAALTVMLLFTGQRTAIFGLVLGTVTLIALGANSWRGVVARLLLVLSPLVVIALLAKAPTNDDVLGRNEDDRFGTVLSHSTRGTLNPTNEDSLQERITTWTYLATEIVPKNPLGMGLGATSLAVARSDKDSALPPIDSYFISSVITCGLPAALLFLFILVRAARSSWRTLRLAASGSAEAQLWRIVTAFMPVLVLNSLFGNTFTLYSVAPIAWLLVGWISSNEVEQESNQFSQIGTATA